MQILKFINYILYGTVTHFCDSNNDITQMQQEE